MNIFADKRFQLFLGTLFLVLIGAGLWASGILPGLNKGPSVYTKVQKVQVDESFVLDFDQEMDQESVQENLIIPDGVQGEVSWQDEDLVFRPSAELMPSEKYEFKVLNKAKTASQKLLEKDLEFRFIVAGEPQLVTQIPAPEASEVPLDTRITMIFDQPMIPLTQVQGDAALVRQENWPVTISPAIDGRWRWLGTTSIVFEPEQGLAPATQYTVNVPAGISSAQEDLTTQDYSWSFSTPLPRAQSLYSTEPSGSYGPNTGVIIDFNIPVVLESVKDLVSLQKITGDSEESVQTEVVDLRSVLFVQPEDGEEVDQSRIKIQARNPLAFNQRYQVQLLAGVRAQAGNLTSPEDFTQTFTTVGDLEITSANYDYFRLSFDISNPLDGETLKDNISISPEPVSWSEENKELPAWSDGRYVSFQPELKARTSYTFTFSPGLKDVFGQSLQEPYTFQFTTDPLPSKVFIHSKGEFGLFEKDKPPVYFLNAINVTDMQVEFAKISLNDLLNIRRTSIEDYEYSPDLSQFESYQTRNLPSPQPALDEWGVLEYDLSQEFGELESGIYAFTLQSPQYRRSYGDQGPIIQQQYFALTDMALTLKYSGTQALVWVVNTQTGQTVDGARVVFHSLNGEAVLRGTTDSEGFFSADLPLGDFETEGNSYNPEFYVTAEKDGDLTFVGSQWNDGLRAYNFGFGEDFNSPSSSADYQVESYVYTERPLYRAGDTVNFKGVVRMRERSTGLLLSPSRSRQAIVKIEDARYQQVFNETLSINEFGSFNGSFTIAEDASLGSYYLDVQITPESELIGNYGGTRFSVLDYRKPEYQVEPIALAENYYDEDTLQFEVQGSYYFGAPMDGAEIQWRATSTDYFFNRYTDGYYSFSLQDAWCWWNCERETAVITEGEGNLDSQGHFSIEFPYSLEDKSLSQIVTLEADVFDPNNQVVSGRVSVPVHKSAIYAGVKPRDYVVAPGESAGVDIITVDPDGNPLSGKRVTAKLYTREWNSIRKKGVDGEYYYENEPEDEFVRETIVTTDQEGKAVAELLVEDGGQHRILVEVFDDEGRAARADTSIYVYSNAYVNWPRANNDRVEVVADQPQYQVGDTAKLIVKSPFQGENVKALVTVEREQVMTQQVITVESNAQAIEIPITEDMIPNAYVSVVIVKPRQGETFNENGLDTGAPAFRIGYSRLLVETDRKELNVSISTDKDRYAPRESVAVTISTTDWQGNPVPAEVSLGVVDLSLLALTGFQMPDLVRVFYSERGLGVNTAQTLLYLIERFKPGSKGGGGAEGDNENRSNFKDTAYWNPTVLTDENGKAQLSFELPDNLTTWQLLAIAHTQSHQFGAIAHEVLETKDVVVRSVRPRFAVVDDQMDLGIIVQNLMEDSADFQVSVTGTGFTHEGSSETSVSLGAGEQTKVLFPVTVQNVDRMSFTFAARSEKGSDVIEESIPVYVYGTPQSVATAGNTEDAVQERVYVPSEQDARDGALSIMLSPTLASFIPDGLQYVVQYPYGCAEQIMSSFLPSVAVAGLEGLDVFNIISDDELNSKVSVGLQKLYNLQRPDGGFGYWQGSRESYAYLSAYILYGMHTAQQFGYSVDQQVMTNIRQYLNGVLRGQDLEDIYDLSTRAYILFVMSETGTVDASLVNNLSQSQDQLPVFAKAMLTMTLNKLQTSSAAGQAESILQNILQGSKVDARGTSFEERDRYAYRGLMNTNTRTTALVLQALVRIDPENPLIPRVVRYLLAVREQGHWDTTQSTAVTILALIEFLESTGELQGDFQATVDIDGDRALDESFNQDNILTQKEVIKTLEELSQGDLNDVTIAKDGEGRLYYDLRMDYFYTADDIPAVEEGMGIKRVMEPVSVERDGQVTVGDTYRVKLTMTVPQDRHFVAVESPLPAGLEIIDLSLQTSQQNLLENEANETEPGQWWNDLWYFNHTEFRDDRTVLFADYLPTGVYEYEFLVRATTPGTFRHRPARIYEMYFPEVFGQSSGEWFEVISADR